MKTKLSFSVIISFHNSPGNKIHYLNTMCKQETCFGKVLFLGHSLKNVFVSCLHTSGSPVLPLVLYFSGNGQYIVVKLFFSFNAMYKQK